MRLDAGKYYYLAGMQRKNESETEHIVSGKSRAENVIYEDVILSIL